MISATYPLRIDSTINQFSPVFTPRGVLISNYSADNIAFDNSVDPVLLIPPGVVVPIAIDHYVSTVKVRSASNTTGYATIKILDSEPDTTHAPNLQQLPGTISATIPSVTIAAGQSIGLTPGATVGISGVAQVAITSGSVGITGVANVAITSGSVGVTGGTVNVQNTGGGVLTTNVPPPIVEHFALTGGSASYVPTRPVSRVLIQALDDSFARGGMFSVYYTMLAQDATAAFRFLIQDQLLYASSFPGVRALGWEFNEAIPVGATLVIAFTGQGDFYVILL
jgi:hypothetical protein